MRKATEELFGTKRGSLLVIERLDDVVHPITKRVTVNLLCQCDCGIQISYYAKNFRNVRYPSCPVCTDKRKTKKWETTSNGFKVRK